MISYQLSWNFSVEKRENSSFTELRSYNIIDPLFQLKALRSIASKQSWCAIHWESMKGTFEVDRTFYRKLGKTGMQCTICGTIYLTSMATSPRWLTCKSSWMSFEPIYLHMCICVYTQYWAMQTTSKWKLSHYWKCHYLRWRHEFPYSTSVYTVPSPFDQSENSKSPLDKGQNMKWRRNISFVFLVQHAKEATRSKSSTQCRCDVKNVQTSWV